MCTVQLRSLDLGLCGSNWFLSVPPQSSPGWVSVDMTRWEDEDNALVNVAKVISQQLGDMVNYMRGQGSLKVGLGDIVTAH